MRTILRVLGLLALSAAAWAGERELIVCGWDEVFILDLSEEKKPRKVWSWRAADRPELPEAYKNKFRTTDECKPVEGNRILITASSDGVALVDRNTRKTLFWALCANAHSAEMLPGNRIAVACSVRESGGNRLAVFDAGGPERELYSTELYSGHGVVWDDQRKTLWALGGRDLRAYSLVEWNSTSPRLSLNASYPLPDPGGHELIAVDDSPLLVLTVSRSTWQFDRDSKAFTAHPYLGKLVGVKGISIHPDSGQVAFIQADAPEWWSNKIRFAGPDCIVEMDGERIYKVRWAR